MRGVTEGMGVQVGLIAGVSVGGASVGGAGVHVGGKTTGVLVSRGVAVMGGAEGVGESASQAERKSRMMMSARIGMGVRGSGRVGAGTLTRQGLLLVGDVFFAFIGFISFPLVCIANSFTKHTYEAPLIKGAFVSGYMKYLVH